ncbi:MAG: polyprenyl synthetase family protein [Gemmatimonadota bacterium]|nr:MAG: polyprenyl synthetase family protein [Gemmatimonadota bacterium]
MNGVVRDFDLEAFLAEQGLAVERALERALVGLLPELPAGLREPLRHGVMSGGKRLRPILCVAAHEACGGEASEGVYDLAVSLELIHCYSLMHDDLPCMDDAGLRRGTPTPHTLFGEAETARVAFALIPAASSQAWEACMCLGCDETVARRIVLELNRAVGSGGMVGGQVLDLFGEDQALTAEELDGLHRRKTGALLTCSLVVGALAAGAEEHTLGALERYAHAIGLAFQVTDDLLDATASAGDLGKHPSDAALGKSTYVSLYGLEEAGRRAGEFVAEARQALVEAEVHAPALRALASYVVSRKR